YFADGHTGLLSKKLTSRLRRINDLGGLDDVAKNLTRRQAIYISISHFEDATIQTLCSCYFGKSMIDGLAATFLKGRRVILGTSKHRIAEEMLHGYFMS